MKTAKYELLNNDTKNVFGKKLYRIRALVGNGLNVSAGQLGGYVEAEKNLSVSGDAWVYGDAQVYGNARVSGDAQVCGNARVSGDAQVCERKSIFWATNVGSENGTLTVYKSKDGLLVTRGCFIGTPEEFIAKSAKMHNEETHWEYKLLLLVAENRINKGGQK